MSINSLKEERLWLMQCKLVHGGHNANVGNEIARAIARALASKK